MDPTRLKKELRAEKMAWRRTLRERERIQRSQRIFEKWRGRFSMRLFVNVHLYRTLHEQFEVDTQPVIHYVRERHPQVRLIIPVVNPLRNELDHVELVDDMHMEKNRWGILEPVMPYKRVFPIVLDMVIVPMLAFDMTGNRLGYGGGFYDKCLPLVRPKCLRVGFCFEEGKVEEGLPTDEYDVPLDFVVTEQRAYRFCDNEKAP